MERDTAPAAVYDGTQRERGPVANTLGASARLSVVGPSGPGAVGRPQESDRAHLGAHCADAMGRSTLAVTESGNGAGGEEKGGDFGLHYGGFNEA
ncbi:uncharacterized protein PpBr36_06515 [Pyricularia pennisetigena]|uniref:uncharacterized protein n=1 Tax=Pyricularia pennisetigena TaxID=1578925 RepID=UPI0011538E1B|nr:uncharacterized protein PpBr36_06515 [Pyricularia pennisetigena]TLS22811.1 hypothetical protein PpBr36_06515 [Pyricularia pennisetigena]